MSDGPLTGVPAGAGPHAGAHVTPGLMRFYRALLYLYPSSFRAEYQHELRAAFGRARWPNMSSL